MEYQDCTLKDITFAKELMERWGISQHELRQYIGKDLSAYYFALGKRPKIRPDRYTCGSIGPRLPEIQEEIDGSNVWVVPWDNIVFNQKEVKSLEETHPELIRNISSPEIPASVEGYFCFKSVEFATGIQRRWPGIEEWELARKIDNKIKNPQDDDFPVPYWMRKHKINPSTNDHIYFCERITTIAPYEEEHSSDAVWYGFDGIVFNMREVSQWEKGKDWLFFVDPGQLPEAGKGSPTEETEDKHSVFLTAEDVCKRWSLSPAQLVDIIHGNEDLNVYWRKWDVPF